MSPVKIEAPAIDILAFPETGLDAAAGTDDKVERKKENDKLRAKRYREKKKAGAAPAEKPPEKGTETRMQRVRRKKKEKKEAEEKEKGAEVLEKEEKALEPEQELELGLSDGPPAWTKDGETRMQRYRRKKKEKEAEEKKKKGAEADSSKK